ncbi:hypothetical protein LGR54_21860 [Ancylobacter sp. Lp-2]|uniref:hypothetical protein n=1 Tax=Ancylobacter sp. Lp-2 TaxID=2881339 RepID=UPI001E630250|nr:hypothetical protein [Ancylobacter sp. Lp-2]MCB4771258.1 hypothetical protein [Ancylobacter sp. Lp-2]
MIDPFALISGFLILCISGAIAFLIRKIVPAALLIAALAILAAVAAVRFGQFEEFAPLLVIYVNGGLMGGLGGFLFAKKAAEPG